MNNLPKIDILLFFGTFDPVHLGHKNIVDTSFEKIKGLEKLIIVPSLKNPWKKINAGYDERIKMLNLVFSNNSKVEISNVEKLTGLQSFNLEILDYFKNEHPKKRFAIIFGADLLLGFSGWRDWEEILKKTLVIFTSRSNFSIADTPRELKPFLGKRIFFLPERVDIDCFLEISSTKVREELKTKKNSAHLDKNVLRYILDNNLYS